MNEWLLAIHPEYAQAILAGEKTVEIRRGVSRLRWQPGDRLWLYATAPVMEVCGAAVVTRVMHGTDRLVIWNEVGHLTGLSTAEFMRYIDGADRISAIHLTMPVSLSAPVGIADLPGVKSAPQSWRLLRNEEAAIARLMSDTSMFEYGPDMEALRTRLRTAARAAR